MPQPIEFPFQRSAVSPGGIGPLSSAYRSGGEAGWRVVTGAPLAGGSGAPVGSFGRDSAALGRIGARRDRHHRGARRGETGPSWRRPSEPVHEEPPDDSDQHDHARGREGHMGVSRDQPAHRRLEMMFKTVLGEVKAIVGGARWSETA